MSSEADTGPELLEPFRRTNSSFPGTEELLQHKARGGAVFGWLCTYVPEELLHAAGVLPVRVTGYDQETDLDDGNAYLYINTCSFARSCLQMGLRGRYKLLDGLVAGSTCDGARRLFDVWQSYIETPFRHMITVPRKFTPAAHDLYYEQVMALRERVETHFGRRISDDSLRSSIAVYNESRALLAQLYALRRSDEPPISGAEVLEVLNAGLRMPKEQFNRLLRALLGELQSSPRRHRGRVRLMVSGSVLNNAEFVRSIEAQGALVVADELCTSTRYWSDPVRLEGYASPWRALSERYLNNFPCARMSPSHERFERILGLVREFRVDGVVSEVIRYCVPYAHDLVLLRSFLKGHDVPLLSLDVEYGTSGSGQVATRVQAFVEMIEGARQ